MSTGVGLQDANGTAIKLSGRHGEYPLEINLEVDITLASVPSSGAVGIIKTSGWATDLTSTMTYAS